jgi:type III secretion system (T3SS) SseB-like protein
MLAQYAAGSISEHAVLTALAGARLLVPVVAVLADDVAGGEGEGAGGGVAGEKASEMAVPAIVGHDGRRALPAFTSLETMRRWQRDARPVPVAAAGVWQSAVRDSQAVIVDIAGPVPVAVEGARLLALANGEQVPHLHEDPDVHAAVAAAAAAQPPGLRVRLAPSAGDADLTLELAPADPGARGRVADDAARAIADDVAARLAGRLRRGIAVVIRPAG